MKTIRSVQQMQDMAVRLDRRGRKTGLVPTMGALHEGHLSLIRRARRENDVVVVSLFVNPAQFGPNEDYLRYPRPFARDSRLCRAGKVDVLFVPSPGDMYPGGCRTFVQVEGMSDLHCGRFRPGHFRGVTTIVTKLFNIVRPARAYFGRKDYQQLTIVQRMTADLNMPVRIVPCPVVRESSGLALSSRNQYLTASELSDSAGISRALHAAASLIRDAGVKDARAIAAAVRSNIARIPDSRIEYAEVCDPGTLEPLTRVKQLPVVILIAAWIGKTRLIDNLLVEPVGPQKRRHTS